MNTPATPSATTSLKPCAGTCRRTLRPKEARASEYPGRATVAEYAAGMCRSCRELTKADPAPLAVVLDWTADRAPQCGDCRRPMRRSHDRAADHPGTVVHYKGGRCVTCHRYASGFRPQGAPRKPVPDACRFCKRKLRTGRTPKAEAPDTIRHGGRGLCITCYVADQQDAPPPASEKLHPQESLAALPQRAPRRELKAAENDAALGGYFARRRQREAEEAARKARLARIRTTPHRQLVPQR